MSVKSSRVLTAALCALSLVLFAGRVNAQNVVDGFADHAVVAASGFFVTTVGSETPLDVPLAPGGTYEIHLAANAWVAFASNPLVHYNVSQVGGFYELFTVPDGFGNNDNPVLADDPRVGTTTDWFENTIDQNNKRQAWGWKASATGNGFPDGGPQLVGSGVGGTNEATLGNFQWNTGTNPLSTEASPQFVYFGFDVFMPGGFPGTSGNTGRLYFAEGGDFDVPEPAFYQMAGFLSLGGLGLLKLRRRRKA